MPELHYLLDELRERFGSDPELFPFFTDGALDGAWYRDVEQPEHEWMSPGFWRLLGHDPEQRRHLAAEWQELIHPEDLAKVVANFEEHCEDSARPYDQVVRFRHADGHTVWVRCRGRAIRDASGRAVRMLGTYTDVTPLALAHEKLRLRTSELEQAHAYSTAEEGRFRLAFDRAPIGMALVGLDGHFIHVNESLCKFLRRSEAELVGLDFRTITHPDDLPADLSLRREVLDGTRNDYQLEKRYLLPDGSIVWSLLALTVARNADGTASHLVAQIKNIHDRKLNADRISARLRAAFDDSFVGAAIVLVDPERAGLIVQANESLAALFGAETEEISGERISRFLDLTDAPKLRRLLEQRSFEPARTETECQLRDAGSRERWVRVLASTVQQSWGGQRHAILQFEEVTERREAQSILQHRSSHDELTDFANRSLAMDRLGQALARSQRSGAHVLIMFIDLDHFKSINDTLGHMAGDKLLADFAARIRSILRPSDTAARFGGDEFVLICDGLSSDRSAALEETNAILARVGAATTVEFSDGDTPVKVTCSIGMRLAQGGADRAENVLREADSALYQAKCDGRARARMFDDAARVEALDRLRIQSSLREAMHDGTLTLHYQPIVTLGGRALVGVEALARWNHPRHGVIPPDRFIRIAEETGLISWLGEFLLEQACETLVNRPAWRDADLPVFLNVSARQMSQANFVTTFERCLSRYGLEPSDFAFELTESILTRPDGSSSRQLQALREMGTKVGIDDFGTGYSALAYLRKLPISFVKLDRTFVSELDVSPVDEDIVKAIVAVADALHLDVIAEGVERREQAAILSRIGCSTAQGFYFGRPSEASVIDALVDAGGLSVESPGS